MQYSNACSQLKNILPLAHLASGSEEQSEVCQRHRQTEVAIPEQPENKFAFKGHGSN